MAQATDMAERIAIGLQYNQAMVEEIFEVADEWDQIPEAERTSWMLDWDQFVFSHLPELDRYYRSGEMTEEQADDYQALLRRLHEGLPLMDRLGIARPRPILAP